MTQDDGKQEKDRPLRTQLDWKDIIALIIVSFRILLPLIIMFFVLLGVYVGLHFLVLGP